MYISFQKEYKHGQEIKQLNTLHSLNFVPGFCFGE